jgi:hypothetical protein
MSEGDGDRREYGLRIEHTYQRIVLARAERDGLTEAGEEARRGARRIERILAELEAEDRPRPMQRLAVRLALTEIQIDFVWTALGCALDGRIVPHLESLGGLHGRRGLSVSVYAALAALDGSASAALADWLAGPNPLVENGLLAPTEDVSPAARAYMVSPRLISFLSEVERSLAPLRSITIRSAELLYDAPQLARISELRAAIETDVRTAVVIEGPRGSGRVTVAGCAVAGELVILDLAHIDVATLPDALVALRREVALRDVTPVLANADAILAEDRPEVRARLGRFIDQLPGTLIITVTVPGTDLAAPAGANSLGRRRDRNPGGPVEADRRTRARHARWRPR